MCPRHVKAKLFFVVLVFIFGLGFSTKASAATYYADSVNGNNSWDGLYRDNSLGGTHGPKLTAGAARVLTAAGDTVYLSGTFREQLIPNSGSEENPITWTGHDSEDLPVIDGTDVLGGAWTQETYTSGGDEIFPLNTFEDLTGWTVSGDVVASGGKAVATIANGGSDYIKKTASQAHDEVWAYYKVKFLSTGLSWVNSDRTYGGGVISGTSTRVLLGIVNSSGTPKWYTRYVNDSGNVDNGNAGTVTLDHEYSIAMHYKRASGAGANDGVVQIWADGSLILNVSTVDNDTLTCDGLKLGNHITNTGGVTSMTIQVDDAKMGTTSEGGNSITAWWLSSASEKNSLFEDGTRLVKATSKAGLSAGKWAWDSASSRIYAVLTGGGSEDPGGHLMEISSRSSCLSLNQKSNLYFKNIKVRGANGSNVTMTASSADVANITFDGIESTQAYNAGFSSSGDATYHPKNIKFINECYSHHNGDSGVQMNLVDGLTVQDSIFDHNVQAPTGQYKAGFRINGSALQIGDRISKNILIERSIFNYNGVDDQGVSTGSEGSGLWFDTVDNTETGNVIARYNTCNNNNNIGIHNENNNYVQIYYNIANYNGKRSGVSGGGHGIYCDASPPVIGYVKYNKIYNNTAVGNGGVGIEVAATWPPGGPQDGAVIGNEVKNNLLIENSAQQTDSAYQNCQFRARWGGENDGTKGNGNIYTNNAFGAEASGFVQWGQNNGLGTPVSTNTYSAWETSYGSSTDSVQTDPKLLNPPVDMSLEPTSPAIDAGTAIPGLTTDFSGNPIYGNPDAGAYEYQPPNDMVGASKDEIDIGAGARIYGNGKFRNYGTISGTTADLTVTPQSGSFTSYGAFEVRPQWLDITKADDESAIIWEANHKKWKELSTTLGATSTLHAIGDLTAGKSYTLKIDGNLAMANITGSDCTSGVCEADDFGKITFTYIGGYSNHTFNITDDIAPSISITSPEAGDTISADDTITFTDTEQTNPQCSLDNSHWDNCQSTVTSFSTLTGWSDIAEEGTFTLYMRDTDGSGNTGSASVANLVKADTQAPVRSGGSPSGELAFGTTSATLSLTTNESATCKYSTAFGTAYAFMANSFTTTNGTAHSANVSNLTSGNSYSYYVRCQDLSENANDTDYLISFSVASTDSDSDKNTDEDNDNEKDLNVHSVKAQSSEDTITITWKTDHNTKSSVRYGTDKNLKEKKKDKEKEKKHKIVLKDLLPNTKYYFRIKTEDSDDNEDSSRIHSIKTKVAEARFIATQEMQDAVAPQDAMNRVSTTDSNPNTCSYAVESGDSLWNIAKKVYGDATAFPLIIEKNKEKYPDIESKLSIGQELSFCDDNQSQQNTTDNSNGGNSNQQSEPQNNIQDSSQSQTSTSRWWNPFSWF